MGWIWILCCVVGTWRLAGQGTLFVVSLVNAIACFWSLGIMHNYADQPQAQSPYEHLVIFVNMVTALAGIGLLIYSFA